MSQTTDKSQKTEQPTAKKLRDAKRDGDVLQSKELGTAIVMIGGTAWLALAGPWFIDACFELFTAGLSLGASDIRHFDPASHAWRLLRAIMLPLFSLFLLTLIAAIAGPALLGSLGFRKKSMAFKGSKMNPLSGLKRMFGTHGLVELAKALAKAFLLGGIGFWILAGDLQETLALGSTGLRSGLTIIGDKIVIAIFCMSAGLAAIAAIDVPIQHIRRKNRLKMSKQEIKDELKQTEGSPEIKQARRDRQQQILTGSARKAVTEATVILTNPTHFSVALRYRPGLDAAPVVVARGRDDIALAIRNLAKDENVPTLEYPQLTRAIYFTSRAGQTISEDLFVAVAAILAFVMNIEKALAEGMPQPDVRVPDDKQFDADGRKKNGMPDSNS